MKIEMLFLPATAILKGGNLQRGGKRKGALAE